MSGAAGSLGFSLDVRLKKGFKSDAQAGTPLARKKLSDRELEPGALDRAVDLWAAAKPHDLLLELGLSSYC